MSLDSGKKVIGIIGGSGLYEMEGLKNVEEITIDTPYGKPSDTFIKGTIGDVDLLFLPRHGRGHRISPSEINYRANIYGLKKLGAKAVISISAVGSMKEHIAPGDLVFVNQFIDRTKGTRAFTFFENGIVAHVSIADPVCDILKDTILEAINNKAELGKIHKSGTYICMEGPQFSTRAESKVYRSLGVDVIGMTACPEYKLAREAQLSYATIALSTDYDCWKEDEAHVTVEQVIATMKSNVSKAKTIIKLAVPIISKNWENILKSPAQSAMKFAVMTDIKMVPAETMNKVKLLISGGN
jgi:5'-methylthioadenosine phosphorylase